MIPATIMIAMEIKFSLVKRFAYAMIFPLNEIADVAMSTTTVGFKPVNAPLISLLLRKASKHFATIVIIIKDGSTVPNVATA